MEYARGEGGVGGGILAASSFPREEQVHSTQKSQAGWEREEEIQGNYTQISQDISDRLEGYCLVQQDSVH